ncbi:MAG: hypothetical protein QOE35_2867 [Actinomycetota bacterium]
MTRREALLIRAFCAWTAFVFVVATKNILGDSSNTFGFKAIHTLIAAVSIAFAIVTWRLLHRVRHRERAEAREE